MIGQEEVGTRMNRMINEGGSNTKICDQFERSTLRWFGHIGKMNYDQILKVNIRGTANDMKIA